MGSRSMSRYLVHLLAELAGQKLGNRRPRSRGDVVSAVRHLVHPCLRERTCGRRQQLSGLDERRAESLEGHPHPVSQEGLEARVTLDDPVE